MTKQKEMMSDFYVYEHIRNDNGSIFYVGKGRKKRAYRVDGRNQFWKRVVNKSNGFSVNFFATNLNEQESFNLEIKRIYELKNQGIKLCNLSNGGEGPAGIVPTKDHKRKISESKKGIKRPKDLMIKIAKKRTVEMIGLKFGRLFVIEMVGERIIGRHPKWKCICDCGNETIRSSTALRFGKNVSCGCAVREQKRKNNDLTGKRFGRLIVTKPEKISDSKRNIIWNCICDCGKNTLSIRNDLISGHKKSCGCLHSEIVKEQNKKRKKL